MGNETLRHCCSLRASSPIWASEVSLARTRERGAEENQTSPHRLLLRAETSSRYQSDPPDNQTCHTDEGGASLALYQSTLFSGIRHFSANCVSLRLGEVQIYTVEPRSTDTRLIRTPSLYGQFPRPPHRLTAFSHTSTNPWFVKLSALVFISIEHVFLTSSLRARLIRTPG